MNRLKNLRFKPYISAIALLLWTAGLGAVSLFFATGNYGRFLFFSYWVKPGLFLLNILPILLLTALLFFIFGRCWAAILGSGVIIVALSFINHIKLSLRSDPLLATDIHYVSEAANISSGYNIMLNRYMMTVLLALLLATVFSLLFLRWKPNKRLRLIGAAFVLLLSAVSYGALYRSETIYAKTENLMPEMSVWSDTDQYVSRGFLYPLLHSMDELSDNRPAGYSKKESAAYAAELGNSDIPSEKQASVIAVMLEAYNDFSKFEGLDFTADPYAYLHELQQESAHGELVTNIFAGNTIDTERAFLTGATSLVEYRAPVDSLARYFSAQGYDSSFCHPYHEWFYNRRNVADYMGFARSHFYEDRYYDHNDYGAMNDTHLFPDLITQLEAAQSEGRPFFNFTVTYQNHGPYSTNSLLYDETYVSREGLSDEAWHILNNYLAGVAASGEALRTLVDSLRAQEEPVVLVVFGDHNPWLGDNGWVFDQLGVSFTGDEGFYNYYSTPWLIWANDAAREAAGDSYVTGEQGSFSPCFLQMELFDLMGWEGSGSVKALRALYAHTDLVHANGIARENGVLTDTPAAETAAAISRYKQLEYYLRKDALK